jgi:hypothetical protein
MPLGRFDRVIGKQSVKPGQDPPGWAEMSLVDARRLDVVVPAIQSARLQFDGSLAGELDAHNRLREIRRRLGAFACTLLYLSVVRDLSWAALGGHYRCDPKTARAWVIAAIKALRTVSKARNGDTHQTQRILVGNALWPGSANRHRRSCRSSSLIGWRGS